jgi:hypothetical protein
MFKPVPAVSRHSRTITFDAKGSACSATPAT